MLDITLNRQSLEGWQTGISRVFRRNLEIAQSDIRQEWQVELFRQQSTHGDNLWSPLSENKGANGKQESYRERKDREHGKGKFPYNTILRRTGEMLDGYVNGIQFYTTNSQVSVTMPYPRGGGRTLSDSILTRALSHQGVIGQPRGVLGPRPFNLEPFKEIAFNRFNEAMKKST